MKLSLGTVQFGLDYGVSNQNGKVDKSEVSAILDLGTELGIDTIDTAAGYGCSEDVLGETGVDNYNVISKLPAEPNINFGHSEWVSNTVNKSLEKLNVSSLSGVLLHQPQDLFLPQGEEIYRALSDLKGMGLIKKIGVSIYEPADLELILNHFDFDIVQAPMNILDQRLITSGWLEKLSLLNIEVHVRSIFLQGLLLMEGAKRPMYFNKWKDKFDQIDSWKNSHNISSLEACIAYVNSYEAVNKIIVGVSSRHELSQIGKVMNSEILSIPNNFSSDDIELITPGMWNI